MGQPTIPAVYRTPALQAQAHEQEQEQHNLNKNKNKHKHEHKHMNNNLNKDMDQKKDKDKNKQTQFTSHSAEWFTDPWVRGKADLPQPEPNQTSPLGQSHICIPPSN